VYKILYKLFHSIPFKISSYILIDIRFYFECFILNLAQSAFDKIICVIFWHVHGKPAKDNRAESACLSKLKLEKIYIGAFAQ